MTCPCNFFGRSVGSRHQHQLKGLPGLALKHATLPRSATNLRLHLSRRSSPQLRVAANCESPGVQSGSGDHRPCQRSAAVDRCEPHPESAGLDPVFARAMAKEPSDRFGSCREFAEQLSQHRSAPILVRPTHSTRAWRNRAHPVTTAGTARGKRAGRRRGVLIGGPGGRGVADRRRRVRRRHYSSGKPDSATTRTPGRERDRAVQRQR